MRSPLRRFERHLRPVFWIATAGTVAMWAIACSSSSSDGSNFGDGGSLSGDDDYPQGDGSTDSGAKDAAPDVVCAYSPTHNDPGCPATYSHSYQDTPCAPVGLQCGYPGAGDEGPNGCNATAGLICHGDGGITGTDAGTLADGGDAGREGTWTAVQ